MSLSKKEIRKDIKEILSRFDDQQLVQKGEGVSVNVISLLRERLPKLNPKLSLNYLIGGFSPIAFEPDWLKKFNLADFKDRFSFPCIREGEMVFSKCGPSELVEGLEFGVKIYSPPPDKLLVVPDVVLIPGLAFTLLGDRLGKGKGYFDKYLSSLKVIKIGVCFEEQIIPALPTEAHDVQVDFVVTDKKIIEIKNK